MKTASCKEPSGDGNLAFSAYELSIVDVVLLKIDNEPRKAVSLLAGAYAAVLCYQAKRLCELTSERSVEPLLRYDGASLTVLPAVRAFIVDVEAICTSEKTAGIEFGVNWARNNPEVPHGQQRSADGTSEAGSAEPKTREGQANTPENQPQLVGAVGRGPGSSRHRRDR